jgi:hypothetical protein
LLRGNIERDAGGEQSSSSDQGFNLGRSICKLWAGFINEKI